MQTRSSIQNALLFEHLLGNVLIPVAFLHEQAALSQIVMISKEERIIALLLKHDSMPQIKTVDEKRFKNRARESVHPQNERVPHNSTILPYLY